MARWTTRAPLASPDDADFVLAADASEADGTRDRTITLGVLRQVLGAGVTVGVSQASHGLSVGDVVRHTGSGYAEATADTASNAEAVGVVSSVPDSDSFAFQTAGVVSTLSGLTAGELYYLQDDGSLGTTAGTVEKPILIAVSTTAAVLILAVSGAAAGTAWGGITGTLGDQTDLQAALDAKLAKTATVQSYAGNRTLDSDNAGAYVRITAAGTVTLPDSLATGFQCVIVNATASDTVALSAATTLTLPTGFDAEVVNRRAVTVIHVGSNVWEAHGALVETP